MKGGRTGAGGQLIIKRLCHREQKEVGSRQNTRRGSRSLEAPGWVISHHTSGLNETRERGWRKRPGSSRSPRPSPPDTYFHPLLVLWGTGFPRSWPGAGLGVKHRDSRTRIQTADPATSAAKAPGPQPRSAQSRKLSFAEAPPTSPLIGRSASHRR